MTKSFKSGFVAVMGRPNVGKSSLVNRMVGEKVAIVSPKPQTTRNRISAILTTENYQVVFEDTPGMHKPRSPLARFMQKSWESAASGTDVALAVIDGSDGLTPADLDVLRNLQKLDCPVFVAVNKTDDAKPERVMPALSALSELGFLAEIIPVSARTGENVPLLLEKLISALPEGEKYYPDGELTDKSERFMASEIVREKVLQLFQQEIPHGVGVTVEKFYFDSEKNLHEIDAVIVCEKASHKPMLIGKGGAALKKVGSLARPELERLTGTKVYLTLWVKVKEGWRDSDNLLRQLGYDSKRDL